MSEKQPKLKFEEDKERTATRSPPKKSKVEQSRPKKQKLKQDADKAAEKAQHLRFGKAEITPDEASRMTKQQKRAMYAAAAARSTVHREVDQYEDDNVGTQALNEGVKSEEAVSDFSKNRYARKLKKKAKLQAKKNTPTAKSSAFGSDKAQSAEATSSEGNSNWFSRWRQKQDVQKSYYAAARSGAAAQTAGGKTVSNGITAAKSGMEQVIDKGNSVVSTAVNGIANFAKSNAHVLLIVGVFLLLLLLVMSAFSSCSILFSGTTQVSGQTIYTAEDRDIRGAETDYKKLEKELDKKIKRTPTDHPGYDEYRYHLDDIEHDPWQLTSFLTTLYDDYTRSEVQAKLKETFAKQYKLTTWVEVQTRYRTVVMIDIFTGIPYTVQVPYEYRIFHTKLVNKGLEVVIREELNNDQWKRYEIFQDTLGGRPYLFNGGLPPGGSDGSGTPGIDYQVPAEALTDSEFAAIYKEAQKYVGTPYVWGGSTPETGFDCSGYVCWVYNQNGYDVGRTTANGLWNKSQHISEAEAKPGDLVFFEGTYDTPGKSHVGIYLGNGMMVSAGDPIKYADIHSSYWQKYLSGFGRLSKGLEEEMSEKLDKLRASLEKEKERRIKINNRIESLERRIQEAEAAEVNEMVRTAKVTPEQLAALLRQSATSTPTPAALSAVSATFNKEESDNEDGE